MGDEDKQFEATQQKLDKARKEGQVVKSKDFSMALSLSKNFISIPPPLSRFISETLKRSSLSRMSGGGSSSANTR